MSLPWPVAIAAITFLSFLFCFRETCLGLIHTWTFSRSFSHCFLIFPCSVYLVWQRRRQLGCCVWQPNYKGLAVLLVGGLSWLWGNLADARIAEQFSFVAMFVALTGTLFGGEIAKSLRFPLVFLFFAVPFGVSLIGPLQDLTAWFTVHALNLAGIPAVLENRMLAVPSCVWAVAEACSGIRYLLASLVLGTFVSSLIYRSTARRLLLVAASAVVPIVANGVRAFLIVTLAYVTGNRIAIGVDHIIYGLLFFVVIQIALLTVAVRWREPVDTVSDSAGASSGYPPATNLSLISAVALALCVSIAWLANHLQQPSAQFAAISSPNLSVAPPWRPTRWHDASWRASVSGATQTFRFTYNSGRSTVQVIYTLFAGHGSATLDTAYDLFVEPRLWALAADRVLPARIEGRDVRVHESMFVGPVTRTVWTWYWVDGQYAASKARLKWLQAKDHLLGRPVQVVAVTVGCDGSTTDPKGANHVLQDFIEHTEFALPMSGSSK